MGTRLMGLHPDILSKAKTISRTHDDCFYLLDLNGIYKRLAEVKREFGTHFPFLQVAYSYKTNNLKVVCQIVKSVGVIAETVSTCECRMAVEDGFRGSEIIFNGPAKSLDDLGCAVEIGAFVNVDCLQELHDWVSAVRRYSISRPKIGIRLAGLYKGKRSRFGLSLEETAIAVRILKDLQIPLSGLHFHIGSNLESERTHFETIQEYATLIKRCVLDNNSPELFRIDVGGGYPAHSIGSGVQPVQLSFFAKSIAEALDLLGLSRVAYELVVEPGRFIVEDSGAFIAKVIAVKSVNNRDSLILNGGTNNVRSIRNWFHPIIALGSGNPGVYFYDIYGCNCFEKDLFSEHFASDVEVRVGDIVVIGSAGGYDLPSANVWTKPAPVIYGLCGDSIEIIRKSQSVSEMRSSHT